MDKTRFSENFALEVYSNALQSLILPQGTPFFNLKYMENANSSENFLHFTSILDNCNAFILTHSNCLLFFIFIIINLY
jgi:hypothetical protein